MMNALTRRELLRYAPAAGLGLGLGSLLIGASPARAASDDYAELVSQSIYPTINPGESFTVWFRLRNVGMSTWRANRAQGYHIEGTDEWATIAVPFGSDVPPGEEDRINGSVAPQTPGVHRYGIRLASDGGVFGPYCYIDVTVRASGTTASTPATTAAATRGTLTFGQSVAGTIASGGQDRWTFSAETGGHAAISAMGFDTVVSLFGPDQALLAVDDDGLNDGRGGSFLDVTLPNAGTYVIQVAGYGTRSGTYTLSLGGSSGSGAAASGRQHVDRNNVPDPSQCTYFAKERMHEATGLWLPALGLRAEDWGENAAQLGWTVGTTPEVASIISMKYANGYQYSYYDSTRNQWRKTPVNAASGHVAWVDVVSADQTMIHVRDRNWLNDGIDRERWFNIEDAPPVKYIYSAH